jgi:hypothetical protein
MTRIHADVFAVSFSAECSFRSVKIGEIRGHFTGYFIRLNRRASSFFARCCATNSRGVINSAGGRGLNFARFGREDFLEVDVNFARFCGAADREFSSERMACSAQNCSQFCALAEPLWGYGRGLDFSRGGGIPSTASRILRRKQSAADALVWAALIRLSTNSVLTPWRASRSASPNSGSRNISRRTVHGAHPAIRAAAFRLQPIPNNNFTVPRISASNTRGLPTVPRRLRPVSLRFASIPHARLKLRLPSAHPRRMKTHTFRIVLDAWPNSRMQRTRGLNR